MIFWNALIWCYVFQGRLGSQRLLAICGVFVGLCMNQVVPLMNSSISPAVLLVCLAAFTNASASVANEFAMKRNEGLDINLQNSVLYSFCATFGIVYVAIFNPERLASFSSFTDGFTSMAYMV